MTEFHIIGLGNLCEFVIKNIDEKQTYGTFSACGKHNRKSMQEFVDYVNQLIKENEQLRHDATILIQSNQDYRRENEQLKKENRELKNKLAKVEEILNNRLNKDFRPVWDDGKSELFIEEKVGYKRALKQLKKKLIKENIIKEKLEC